MELLAALKTARSLAAFVEGGALEEALAQVSVGAAVDAMEKSRIARDPRAQVWSAVTHLETAWEAHRRILVRPLSKHLAWTRHRRIWGEFDHVTCLMAVCYRYLGEIELSEQCFTRWEALMGDHYDPRYLFQGPGSLRGTRRWAGRAGWLVGNIPAHFVEEARASFRAELPMVNPREVREALRAL
ncbi:hypothetical protein GCM10009836_18320 [Pseudonocardia ailaonensis]|uniref:Uncharacterized protein n=1 Tax=Pseudonocardia ailaonensis TaxID=367279 RepID=A0ABN2MUT7_9PSEU